MFVALCMTFCSIGFTYGHGDNAETGQCHGGRGGKRDHFNLQENEYIVKISGMSGNLIDEVIAASLF